MRFDLTFLFGEFGRLGDFFLISYQLVTVYSSGVTYLQGNCKHGGGLMNVTH